jgi:hypothetical protein
VVVVGGTDRPMVIFTVLPFGAEVPGGRDWLVTRPSDAEPIGTSTGVTDGTKPRSVNICRASLSVLLVSDGTTGFAAVVGGTDVDVVDNVVDDSVGCEV